MILRHFDAETDRHADKKRQRIDCEREQHPAEEAEADEVEGNTECEHGGYFRDSKGMGCAFHHLHGAVGNSRIRSNDSDGSVWYPGLWRAFKPSVVDFPHT